MCKNVHILVFYDLRGIEKVAIYFNISILILIGISEAIGKQKHRDNNFPVKRWKWCLVMFELVTRMIKE